jgi:hypothetical protein
LPMVEIRHSVAVRNLNGAKAPDMSLEPLGPDFPPGSRDLEQARRARWKWSLGLSALETPLKELLNVEMALHRFSA